MGLMTALWKYAAFGFLGFCVFATRFDLAQRELDWADDPSVYYIPKASSIRPFFLGHEAFVADLTWIRTLGYFADEAMLGRSGKYLESLIEFATDLDPRFEKIYIWSGAVTMYSGGGITKDKVRASNRILEKGWRFIENDPEGWRHDKDYWLIPQMIGFNYAIELGEKAKGAPFIAKAGKIPGAPDLYKTWAATLYKKAGDLESASRVLEDMLAVEMLRTQLQNVEDEKVRENIQLRLRTYYERLYGKDRAKERIDAMLAVWGRLRSAWQSTFPYLDFQTFLILWSEPIDDFVPMPF